MVKLEDKYLTAMFVSKLTDKSFKIVSPGRIEEMTQADGSRMPKLIISIELSDKKAHDWIPNETSKKVMRKRWGDDTNAWVGKQGELEIIRQSVRGEVKDIIFVKK